MEEKTIEELQKEENEIWEHFNKVLNVFQRDKISRLIEVNLELEKLSNQ